jgi:hypothetical protein
MFSSHLIKAQGGPIMACNSSGTLCEPYNNIDSAITNAASGSFIYLPGGVFVINVSINKEIHLFGAGHNGDSSQVTGTTIINGNINLGSNASQSGLEGLYLTGSIMGPGSPSGIQNVSIRHCNIYAVNMMMNNSTIHGSIFRGGGYNDNTFYNGINNTISNCYIQNVTDLSSSTIDRCTGIIYCNNVHLTTIKNSIFNTYVHSPYGQSGSSNSLYNCVYVSGCPYYCLSLIYYSNVINVGMSNLFTNGFNYNDMKLVANSPALTAGENGTQVGVYGGLFPYKAGAVPSTPHIFQSNISASTNASGQLPVQIKVRAEDY